MMLVDSYKIDRRLIFALFLLPPIFSFLNVPGKYTIISLLFVAVYLYYANYMSLRRISVSYPLVLWFILTIYHWINAMQKRVPEVDIYDLLHGFKIYACMTIFIFLARKDFNQTIRSLLLCFLIYLTLGVVLNKLSGTSHNGRLSGVIFATALGQAAALTGVYVAFYSVRNNLKYYKSGLLYLLPLLVIIQTQSRNSLAMLFIIIMGQVIASLVKKKVAVKKIVSTVFLVFSFSVLIFWLIGNTELGERLKDTETAESINYNNDYQTNTVFDDIAGDRLIYYVLGWQYLMDSPFTGIGMWNFMYVSQGDYPLHSEYMIHLAEGGAIGAIIWTLFLIAVIRGLIQSKKPKYLKILALFALVQILFCGIYARVFYYEIFYPVFGVIISLTSWGRSLKLEK